LKKILDQMTIKPISIIVAVGENRAIGFRNRLLWMLPDDMKFFKTKTTGHTVIMGRNTFLSLPKGALPDRRNIVITDRTEDDFSGCVVVSTIEEAIKEASSESENFIIGGASIYRQFFSVAQKLYYTHVMDSPEADTFFPQVNDTEWRLVSSVFHPQDLKHPVSFTFREYHRITV